MPTSSKPFSDQTSGDLNFTNIVANETDNGPGTFQDFTANSPFLNPFSNGSETGIIWSSVIMKTTGAAGAVTTQTVTITYNVAETGSNFITSIDSLYAIDTATTTSNATFTAVETIADAAQPLIVLGTQTFTYVNGELPPSPAPLIKGVQHAVVTLTLTETAAPSTASTVSASVVEQLFGENTSPLAALGDYVWMDTNKDGLQSSGETGVANVTVDLLDATGTTVLAITQTDSVGHYMFTGLLPGAYEVKFIAPLGDNFTTQTVGSGSNAATDSNPNQTTGITAPVTLAPGETNPTIDAGLVIPSQNTTGVTLDKQISGDGGATWVDAGNAVGIGTGNNLNDPNVLVGSKILERVIAVNTGNVAITGASVTDVGGNGPAGFAFGGSGTITIAAGATVTSDIATITAALGYELDTATINGTSNGGTVSAHDQANYTGLPYSITLDKQISADGSNWVDVGTGAVSLSGTNAANGLPNDPSVLVGSKVYERVIVANTGSVTITGAAVTDVGGNGPAGFTFSNAGTTTLAAGATITSDVATISAASGYELDTATVNGNVADAYGNHGTVTATDQANYTGTAVTTGVTLDKQISGDGGATWVDAGNAVGIGTGNNLNDPNVLVGSKILERVIAVNTGNVAITGASVTDVGGNGPAGFAFGGSGTITIAAGATVTSDIATITAALGYELDTATINGTSNGGTVSAHDQANYTGLPYSITLDKQISADGSNWVDVGTGAVSLSGTNAANGLPNDPSVLVGSKVYERVIVANTGSVTITGAAVTDVGGNGPAGFTFSNAGTTTLAAGATITSDVATISAASGYELDTATVNGNVADAYGNHGTVTATDQANYTGTAVTTGVTLDKQISGDGGATWVDAGNAVGIGTGNNLNDPNVLVGSKILERVIAVNTGNVAITGASVTDVGGNGPAGFAFGGSGTITIAAGATVTSDIATITAALGYELDTATINGTSNGGTVSAHDQANYTGLPYSITLDKQISADGSNWVDVGTGAVSLSGTNAANGLPNDPSVLVGSKVYERVIVANTGSVTITGAAVTDVGGNGPAGFTFSNAGTTTLAAGATITSDVATISAASGYELDTATVNGNVADAYGNHGTVTATDQANYTGTAVTTGVTLDKQISGDGGATWVDAGNAVGIGTGNNLNDPNVLVGSKILERVIAVNTGNVAITGASVTDVGGNGPAGFAFGGSGTITIAAGATVTSDIATITAALGYELDTATINGTSNGGTVSAHDQANYTGLPYSITLDKQISTDCTTWTEVGVGNLSPQPTVAVGSKVYERVVIVNTGSVTISSATVSDEQTTGTGTPAQFNFGSTSATSFSLTAGGTIISNTATLTAASGEETDKATVTGTAADNYGHSVPVTANDSADYTTGGTPGILVNKVPCTMVINQCGQETYTFNVTNTGSTPITNINIKDNIGTAANPDNITPTPVKSGSYNIGDTNKDGTLSPGETWVYTVTDNPINDSSNCCGTVSHTCSGSNLGSGDTAWFSCSFTPTSTKDGTCYVFKGVRCDLSGGYSKGYSVDCPDAVVTFSSSCKQATTTYDFDSNCWKTTLPANCNPGDVFLSGCPVKVPSGCDFTNAKANWSIDDSGNNCGSSSVNWSAACQGYGTFNQYGRDGCSDYNAIGVKVCDNKGDYGTGGSCDTGYGYYNGGYTNCGGGGWNGWGGWGCNSDWNGSSNDCAGTPENQYTGSSCGSSGGSYGGWGGGYYGGWGGYGCGGSNNGGCGNGGSGSCGQVQVGATGVADTVTVTGTSGGTTVTASDTSEIIVLGCPTSVSVNGTGTTANLNTYYGSSTNTKPQTLEFTYNSNQNTVPASTVGAMAGTNTAAMAFIVVSTNKLTPTAAGAQVFFEGTVANGNEFYADASINSLTNTPNPASMAFISATNIYADIYASQAAFLSGAAPVQTDTITTNSSTGMHLNEQIGNLSLVGYIGATGGHLHT